MSNTAQDWWAYNAEMGWVVLDREIFENSPQGYSTIRYFYRCADWTVCPVERKLSESWPPPGFIFERTYLSSFKSAENLEKEINLLGKFKNEFFSNREVLKRKIKIQKNRESYHNSLKKLGKISSEKNDDKKDNFDYKFEVDIAEDWSDSYDNRESDDYLDDYYP